MRIDEVLASGRGTWKNESWSSSTDKLTHIWEEEWNQLNNGEKVKRIDRNECDFWDREKKTCRDYSNTSRWEMRNYKPLWSSLNWSHLKDLKLWIPDNE